MTVSRLRPDVRHLPFFTLPLASLLGAAAGGPQSRADEGNRLIDYAGFAGELAERPRAANPGSGVPAGTGIR